MVSRRGMMNLAAGGAGAAWWIAIVYAADGVRFVAVGRSRAVLVSRLAVYVMEQAPRQLWPDDASRVHQMLSGGALDVAIDLYFASVGNRWDKEWLHAEEVDHAAVYPPSTNSTAPVTYDAAPEARNTTGPTNSRSLARRPNGVRA